MSCFYPLFIHQMGENSKSWTTHPAGAAIGKEALSNVDGEITKRFIPNGKEIWQHPARKQTNLPFHPEIPRLGIYLRYSAKNMERMCKKMYINANIGIHIILFLARPL